MQPGRQWSERIKIWIDAIQKEVYKPIGKCDVKYFTTFEQLSFEDALKNDFEEIKTGTAWGKKWEYAWFKGEFVLPEEAEGKRIVCVPDVGSEAICFVNGKPRGAFDKQHKEILINRNAKAGEKYELLLEAYAGHGPRLENGGPYPMEVTPVPEPGDTQCKLGKFTYGIWQEEAYQLYIDAFVLWDLYQILDPKSLRAMKVLDGLKEMTYIADVELEGNARLQSFVEARKVLAPLLDAKNGDSTPTMFICGQSHLDLAWLWTIDETKRKSGRTYSNQLTLMEEYPEYKYLACDPYVLKFLKKYYPETYKDFLEKVKSGQMILDGGTYVEPDLNMPCGEALIRHFVYGKEAFWEIAKEAGIENADSKFLWLTDVFGFPGSIPQIMKMCGLKYFSTQKLMRSDPETEDFPYNNFIWEGIDGSQVLANVHMKNNTRIRPSDIHERWYVHRHQETGIDAMLYPFGFGDGGGGATREMVEIANRVENLEGIPKTKMTAPSEFFEYIKNDGYRKPVYRGEMYLAWHRGTFTSQSELKRGNRMAETALRKAESLIANEYMSGDITYEEGKEYEARIGELWDTLMYLQFHDVLPGSSIQKVNEDARKEFNRIIKECFEIKQELKNKVTIASLEVNSTTFTNKNVVQFKKENGLANKIFVTEKGKLIEVKNSVFTAVFEIDGTLSSLRSNKTGKEFLKNPGNVFHMYKNVNCMYDAWEMGSMIYDEEVPLGNDVTKELRVVETTSDSVILEYARKINKSDITQQIVIGADSPVIYFETTINWQERHKLLKVSFHPDVHTREGIEEIQYGYIKRSFGENHQFEKDQYEVINHGFSALADENHGLAVLNDGKYGVKVADKEISLSLLRAPVIPDMTADLGMHNFTYACMLFDESFCESDVVNEARKLQERSLEKIETLLNVKNLYSGNNMSCEPEINFVSLNEGHAVLDWMYLSSKEEGLIVVRMYESMNLAEDVVINCKCEYKKIAILDPYEDVLYELGTDNKIHLEPFKVVTLGIYTK